MFWDKAYTPSPNIEALLQKENLKVEELLDDEDILQECKNQKRNLVQYLTRPDIIKRLIELIITEPPEELPIAQRFKYANVACEILTFGLPSLDEKLVGDPNILQTLYSFLEQEPPLNPLLSSFFSKAFSMLITKKSEQDWFLYQKMCLQMLEFIKSRGNFLDLIFRHFATPVIMDLLLQIIREIQGGALKKNFYEWLTEQQLVERLINMLGQSEESEKHNNIAEFLSDLIRNGRSIRQREDNDSFEPAFIGSDPLLQVIEEEKTISLLLDVILGDGSSVEGDNDGNGSGAGVEAKESSIVAGINIVLTLVDESIVDEPASDEALRMIIDKEKDNYQKIVSTVIRVVVPKLKIFHYLLLNPPKKNFVTSSSITSPPFGLTRLEICRLLTVLLKTGNKDIIKEICETEYFNTLLKQFKQYSWNNFLHSEVEKCFEYVFATFDQNDNEKGFDLNPSALQIFVIVNCKIVPKLIDCWIFNRDVQSSTNGHRLGYMGHLIQIFKHIISCISNSDHIGALIESNLNEEELEIWKSITNKQNGELTIELDLQNRFLADCNAHDVSNYNASLPKEFHNENLCSEIYNEIESKLRDCIGGGSDLNSTSSDKLLGLDVINCFLPSSEDSIMNLERDFKVWDGSLYNNDDDQQQPLNITVNPWGTDPFSDNHSINNCTNMMNDESSSSTGGSGGGEGGGWADFSNNFADFDSHFNSFMSDLDGYINNSKTQQEQQQQNSTNSEMLNEFKINNNNANVFGKFVDFDKDDDGNDKDDDELEIHFKNAKNLDMKKTNNIDDENDDDEEENSSSNYFYNDNADENFNEHMKYQSDNDLNVAEKKAEKNGGSEHSGDGEEIPNENAANNSNNANNDNTLCENADNNKKVQEAQNFSEIFSGNTQTVNNSDMAKIEIDTEDVSGDTNDDEDHMQQEQQKQHEIQQQTICTSNGPVKDFIDSSENSHEVFNKQQRNITTMNEIAVAATATAAVLQETEDAQKNDDSKQPSSLSDNVKLTIEPSSSITTTLIAATNFEGNNVSTTKTNNDLSNDLPTTGTISTTTTTSDSTTTTTSDETAPSSDDVNVNIPPDTQENGPV